MRNKAGAQEWAPGSPVNHGSSRTEDQENPGGFLRFIPTWSCWKDPFVRIRVFRVRPGFLPISGSDWTGEPGVHPCYSLCISMIFLYGCCHLCCHLCCHFCCRFCCCFCVKQCVIVCHISKNYNYYNNANDDCKNCKTTSVLNRLVELSFITVSYQIILICVNMCTQNFVINFCSKSMTLTNVKKSKCKTISFRFCRTQVTNDGAQSHRTACGHYACNNWTQYWWHLTFVYWTLDDLDYLTIYYLLSRLNQKQ